MPKQHRFFFHYNKPKNLMTVHYRGECYTVKHIKCGVPVETKWNTTQPRIVMRGWCNGIQINFDNSEITIY